MKKKGRFFLAFFAIAIGLYPLMYLLSSERKNFLAIKPDEYYFSAIWQTGFHFHIIFGGIALLIGWMQFLPRFRNKYPGIHRKVGMAYVMAVLLGGLAGMYLAVLANGGIVAKTGFFLLGVGWTSTAVLGFLTARKRDFIRHEKAMIFSYAFCFAAVTLRIWLPSLEAYFGEFLPAYRIVSWLCWVPNVLVAWWIIAYRGRRIKHEPVISSR